MFSKELIAFAASLSTASAVVYQGFNYGSGLDYATEFANAKALVGTSGAFTSARLYTMIEEGTTDTPTSAIQAAIDSDVTLLLGLWASGGQADLTYEIAALTAAISTYGTSFTDRVSAISVGSEDLYRISPTGIINKSGVGAEPATLVDYISQVRSAISGTALSGALVGHVDTWTAWVNGSNDAVIDACDFIGMDAYPYFQNTQTNAIGDAYDLFFSAYDQTVSASSGKPVWVTETGWPVSGPTSGDAVPSTANAKTYWDQVGCKLFGTTNTYWYTLDDAGASPSFGVTTGSDTPLYDLTCSASSSSSSSSASSTASSTSTSASATVVISPSTTTESASTITESASTTTEGSSIITESASTVTESASTIVESASTTESASETSAASSTESASVTSATASESTPSQTLVSVTTSAVPSESGSPADSTSKAADSSASVFETASSSAYSSAEASASSVASAASTDSTATGAATASSGIVTSTATATTSGVISGTSTAAVSAYTGGAAAVRSTGGFVAAVVALLAAL